MFQQEESKNQSSLLSDIKRVVHEVIAESVTPRFVKIESHLDTQNSDLVTIHTNIDDMIVGQTYIANLVVTHSELDTLLKYRLDELSDDLKYQISIECEKVRHEILRAENKVNGRVDDVVVTLEKTKIITRKESDVLLQTSPLFGA